MDHVQEMEAIKRLLIERGVRILIAEVHDHMGSPWTIECDTTPPIYVTADGRDGGFKVEYWADYDRTERLWFQFPEMESVLYMPFSEYKRESVIDAVVRTIGRSTAWRR